MAQRGTQRVVLRPLAAYTTTYTSRPFTKPYHKGIVVNIRATALTSTPSVVVKIQGWDTDGSGAWVDLLADAAVTTASPTHSEIKMYPGAITAANAALDRPLPQRFRIVSTHANANSMTYELFFDLVA